MSDNHDRPRPLALLPPPKPAPRRVRVAGVLCVALAVAVSLFGALGLRASVAPLGLPLSAQLTRGIEDATGLSAELSRVALQLLPLQGGLEVTAEGLTLAGPFGAATLPRVRLRQTFDGRGLVVDGAQLSVQPDAFGPPGGVPVPKVALETLFVALADAGRAAADARLRQLRVIGADVELLADAAAGPPRAYRSLEATLSFEPDGALSAEASMVGAGGVVRASLTNALAEGALSASATGLTPADLVADAPVEDGLGIAPALAARFDEAGALEGASLTLAVDPGTVRFARDPPRRLTSAGLDLAVGADGIVTVRSAEFVAGPSTVVLSGTVRPVAGEAWPFTVRGEEAILDPPDMDGPPVIVEALRAEGRLALDQGLVHVERFAAELPSGRFDAVFTLDFADGELSVTGAAHAGSSRILDLLGAWPPVFAHEPRAALVATALSGFVRSADLDFALGPLELDGDPTTNSDREKVFHADVNFANATLTVPELPVAIQRASGLMRLRDRTLSARLDRGIVVVEGAEPLSLLAGALTIRTLGETPATATVSVTVEGELAAVVSLANTFGVEEVRGTALDPDDVTGDFRATVALSAPLGEELDLAAAEWSIDATLRGAGSSIPINGQTFQNADIEVLVNPRRLAARGSAEIGGLAVDVNYSELFAGRSSGAARFVLTDKDREARGFATGEMVRGPVVVTLAQGEDGASSVAADLTEASVDLPIFKKPAGEPLFADALVKQDGEDVTVEELELEGETLAVSGRLALEDGALTSLELPSLTLSQGDDASLAVIATGEASYRAELNAARFDARPLLEGLKAGAGGSPEPEPETEPQDGPAISLSANARAVRLSADATFEDVALSAEHNGASLQRLSLNGRIDGLSSGAVAASLEPTGDGTRALKVDVADLGRALAALDAYERMRGGRTTIDARLDADGTLRGRAVATGFTLAGERTLEEVLAETERARREDRGPRSAGPLAFAPGGGAQGGLSFQRLVVDFEKRGDVLTVREAILTGPVLGGTAEGTVDLAAGTVALNGTFIPAYGVNNLFGRVPLFGEILGGGDKGGLIGLTFRLSGPLDEPSLSLNPMSAIAPGIFRRIFEFR